MNNIKQLRERLRENPAEKEQACKLTGLKGNALKRKLYNPKKFTLWEIVVFKRLLSLSMDETIKIFAPFVANHN